MRITRGLSSFSIVIIGLTGPSLADDCNNNGQQDALDILTLYVGTQGGGGGGGAQVWRYSGNWNDLTPTWNASAVKALVMYEGHLYAGVQTAHGYGGTGGVGEVWRNESGNTWTRRQKRCQEEYSDVGAVLRRWSMYRARLKRAQRLAPASPA